MALITKDMKRRLYIILTASAALMAASCEKAGESISTPAALDPSVIGEWHLSRMLAEGSLIEDMPDVYLAINPDGTFELYQKSGTQSLRHDRFTGTCYTQDGILSGVYSNGDAWGSKWEYVMTLDGLLLKSFNMLEENLYVKTEIPREVRINANDVVVKSYSTAPIL